MSSAGGGGISVGTYSSGTGDEVGYRTQVQEGPGPGLGLHNGSASTSYGPGTGPSGGYYPSFVTSSRGFPESQSMSGSVGGAPAGDTGATGHQSSCGVLLDATPPVARRHLISTGRYPGDNPAAPTCIGGGTVYNQPCSQQQHATAHMMAAAAAAGDPSSNFVLWTPAENGYASYVVDPRSGATVPRSLQHTLHRCNREVKKTSINAFLVRLFYVRLFHALPFRRSVFFMSAIFSASDHTWHAQRILFGSMAC